MDGSNIKAQSLKPITDDLFSPGKEKNSSELFLDPSKFSGWYNSLNGDEQKLRDAIIDYARMKFTEALGEKGPDFADRYLNFGPTNSGKSRIDHALQEGYLSCASMVDCIYADAQRIQYTDDQGQRLIQNPEAEFMPPPHIWD